MAKTPTTTHWRKLITRPMDSETLPIAVAILIPSHPTVAQANQLKKTLQSVSFAQSVWLGETNELIADFAAARNGVLPLVAEPWILWLDSDEWFESSIQVTTEPKKLLAIPDISGIYLHRQDWFLGQPLKHGEPASVKFLRLMKTQSGRFHRPVHEVFTSSGNGFLTDSTIVIQHASHDSISEFLTAVSNYARLEAQFRYDTVRPSTLRLISEFLIFPKIKFLYNFFWLGGWQDGWRGLIYAIMMSIHSAAVRIYGWELMALKSVRSANE